MHRQPQGREHRAQRAQVLGSIIDQQDRQEVSRRQLGECFAAIELLGVGGQLRYASSQTRIIETSWSTSTGLVM